VKIEATTNTRPKFDPVKLDIPGILTDLLKIVKLDIQAGINEGVGIDGQPFPALSPQTVERKGKPHPVEFPGRLAIQASRNLNAIQRESMRRGASSFNKRKGGVSKKGARALQRQQALYISPTPEKPLVDSGNLLFNQEESIQESTAVLKVGKTRLEAATELQVTGVGKNAKKFYFFGISQRAQEKMTKYLQVKFHNSFVEARRG